MGADMKTSGIGMKRGVAVKRAVTKPARASYILEAPKGPRTVSHRKIKAAVDKLFSNRIKTSA